MEIVLNSCLTAYEKVKKGEIFIRDGQAYIKMCHGSHTFHDKGGRFLSSVGLSDGEPLHLSPHTLVRVIQGKFTEMPCF